MIVQEKHIMNLKGCIGGFDYRERNKDGDMILNFVTLYDTKMVNICFKKRNEYLITHNSGHNYN